MQKPPIPDNDDERLKDLYSYDILDTTDEEIFDNITWIAALVCNVPMSLISLVDKDRQWFKAVEGMDCKQSPRDVSFCAHAITQSGIFEINDATTDERFADNPFVLEDPNIRFYAGIPLVSPNNFNLGTLCVIDKNPKQLTTLQKNVLTRLSQIVIALFEARKIANERNNDHEQSELILRESSEKLASSLHAMEQRNREIMLLTELTSILQSCAATEEAFSILQTSGKQLFPGTCGNILLNDSGQEHLQSMVSWGEGSLTKKVFTVDNCWAIRRGQVYALEDSRQGLVCKHLQNDEIKESIASLCIPLMAQGETLGLFCVEFPLEAIEKNVSPISASQRLLAIAFAEQSALALANIKLRKKLHEQSNSDVLTGLSNRRYLDNQLSRILKESALDSKPVSIILLDVDHFKIINDTYGHEVGDMVLQKLSGLFQESSRSKDIMCRLGGDEFLLVYPDMSLDKAIERAESLRAAASNLELSCQGKLIGPITLSLGVADAPAQGTTADKLVQAADKALYKAKEAGRNQVGTA